MQRFDLRLLAPAAATFVLCLSTGGIAGPAHGQAPGAPPASGDAAEGVAASEPPTCIVYELFDDGETYHYELSCCEEPQHFDLYFTTVEEDVVECANRSVPPDCAPLKIDFRLGDEPCCGACVPDDQPNPDEEPKVEAAGAFGRGIDAERRKRLDEAGPRKPHRPYSIVVNEKKEAIKFKIEGGEFGEKTFVFYRKQLRQDPARYVTVAIEIPGDCPNRFAPYHNRMPQVKVDEDLCAYEAGKGPSGLAPFAKVGLKFIGVPGMPNFSDCCFVVLRDKTLWQVAGNP